MKRFSGILALILILGVSGLVVAHPGGGFRFGFRDDNYDNQETPYYRSDHNFTLEQEDQLAEIEEEYYEKRLNLQDEISEKQYELNDLYYDSEVSSSEIKEKQNEVDELRDQLYDLRREEELELREILTSEQLEEIYEYENDPRNKPGYGPGSGPGYGPMGGFYCGRTDFRGTRDEFGRTPSPRRGGRRRGHHW
ncbi:MAG: Spy/CpxP family protein refolding chaperone [Bacillota bacterium]